MIQYVSIFVLLNIAFSAQCTELLDAIKKDDLHHITELIDKGVDVNYGSLTTPLHEAVQKNINMVTLLIGAGAKIHAKDCHGWTVLHAAIAKGDEDIIALLIEFGANIQEQNHGYTALHVAVSNEHLSIAKSLLASGLDINAHSKDGWTPLHVAACKPSLVMVKFLIEAGCEPSKKIRLEPWTSSMKPGIIYSPRNRDTLFWENLSCQRDREKLEIEPFLNELYGRTNLLLGRFIPHEKLYEVGSYCHAIYYSYCCHFSEYCDCKVIVDMHYDQYYDRPLQLLVAHKTNALKRLLQRDSTLINKQDEHIGATLLMYASALGHDDIVDLLLTQGADPLLTTKQKKTVFDFVFPLFNVHASAPPYLAPAKKLSYEKILQWCKIQVNMRYVLPLLALSKGKPKEGRDAIREAIKNSLRPHLMGEQASRFKSSQKLPNPAILETKPQKSLLNKKSIVLGATVMSCLAFLYWYFYSQESLFSLTDEHSVQNITHHCM